MNITAPVDYPDFIKNYFQCDSDGLDSYLVELTFKLDKIKDIISMVFFSEIPEEGPGCILRSAKYYDGVFQDLVTLSLARL